MHSPLLKCVRHRRDGNRNETYRVQNDHSVLGNKCSAIVEVLSAHMGSSEPERVVDSLDFLQFILVNMLRRNIRHYCEP